MEADRRQSGGSGGVVDGSLSEVPILRERQDRKAQSPLNGKESPSAWGAGVEGSGAICTFCSFYS